MMFRLFNYGTISSSGIDYYHTGDEEKVPAPVDSSEDD